VNDILVANDGSMVADLKIRRDFDRFVRVDSVASIKKVFGIAGDSFMEISRGTGAVLRVENPTIPCLPSEDSLIRMEKILSDLRAEVMPVVAKAAVGLDEWTRLGADLQKNGEQLRQFVARLGEMLNGVEQGKGTVGKLFTDNTIADEAKHLLLQANQTVTEIRGVVTNLNTASKSIQAGAERLPEIANAVATETKELPGLVQQTQTSMREAERLIEAMQHHWLWRKYLNKTNPPSLHPLAASEEPDRNKFKSLRSPKDSR
jgi:phospholipid/cholesterol/gamma-HCH transport system substrate-binding protein